MVKKGLYTLTMVFPWQSKSSSMIIVCFNQNKQQQMYPPAPVTIKDWFIYPLLKNYSEKAAQIEKKVEVN